MAYLKTLPIRVSYQDATGNNEPPYVVVDIVNMRDDGEGRQSLVVDIDFWDKNADTTELDELVALVNGDGSITNPTGLNKRTLTNDNGMVTFFLDDTLSLKDDDKRIRRRKCIYQAHAFSHSEGAD